MFKAVFVSASLFAIVACSSQTTRTGTSAEGVTTCKCASADAGHVGSCMAAELDAGCVTDTPPPPVQGGW